MASGWPGKGHGALLKKAALSRLRPQIGLETTEIAVFGLRIRDESGHQGSFSTGWGVLGSNAHFAAFATMGARRSGGERGERRRDNYGGRYGIFPTAVLMKVERRAGSRSGQR